MSNRRDVLTVYWRGSLSSCNYACGYCPFAKTKNTRAELDRDKTALERFASWTKHRDYPLEILITPWGEALIRNYYREAMMQMSHQENIHTIGIQTNLSCSLGWLSDCNLSKIAFWTTFHPGEVSLEKFVSKIAFLEERGARYSVGIVGTKENTKVVEELRRALPENAYLWINADRSWPIAELRSSGAFDLFTGIDPLFALNTRSFPSKGLPCRGGRDSISVSWDGRARRCHFVNMPIGNIYDDDFESKLRPKPCPARTCNCHIGYSNLDALDMNTLYDGFIERRARKDVAASDAEAHLSRFRAHVAKSL